MSGSAFSHTTSLYYDEEEDDRGNEAAEGLCEQGVDPDAESAIRHDDDDDVEAAVAAATTTVGSNALSMQSDEQSVTETSHSTVGPITLTTTSLPSFSNASSSSHHYKALDTNGENNDSAIPTSMPLQNQETPPKVSLTEASRPMGAATTTSASVPPQLRQTTTNCNMCSAIALTIIAVTLILQLVISTVCGWDACFDSNQNTASSSVESSSSRNVFNAPTSTPAPSPLTPNRAAPTLLPMRSNVFAPMPTIPILPTLQPTLRRSTTSPTTTPTIAPTQTPTRAPVTEVPTVAPTTAAPTSSEPTVAPTMVATTAIPTTPPLLVSEIVSVSPVNIAGTLAPTIEGSVASTIVPTTESTGGAVLANGDEQASLSKTPSLAPLAQTSGDGGSGTTTSTSAPTAVPNTLPLLLNKFPDSPLPPQGMVLGTILPPAAAPSTTNNTSTPTALPTSA